MLYRMVTTLAHGPDGFVVETNRVPVWRIVVAYVVTLADRLSGHWFCDGVLDVSEDVPEGHWRDRVWTYWQYLAGLEFRPRFYVDRGYISDEKAKTQDPEFYEMVMSFDLDD